MKSRKRTTNGFPCTSFFHSSPLSLVSFELLSFFPPSQEEQTRLLNEAQQRLSHLQGRLSLLATSDPRTLIQDTAGETAELTKEVDQILPQRLQAANARLAQLAELTKETDHATQRALQREAQALRKELEDKRAAKAKRDAERERLQQSFVSKGAPTAADVMRQRGLSAEKQRLDTLQLLRQKQADRAKLQADIDERRKRLGPAAGLGAGVGAGGYGTVGEQIERMKQVLREKAQEWNEKKKELDALQAEIAVLARTEEILKERDTNLKEFIDQQDAKRGFGGFRQQQEQMNEISKLKQMTDEEKQRLMEEHTQTVLEIQRTIAEKRASLAPAMAKRQEARVAWSEIMQQRNEKKQAYDSKQMQYQQEESALKQEVLRLRTQVQQCEHDWLRTQLEMNVLSVTEQKATGQINPPDKGQGDRPMTYNQLYKSRDKELRDAFMQLREQKKQTTV